MQAMQQAQDRGPPGSCDLLSLLCSAQAQLAQALSASQSAAAELETSAEAAQQQATLCRGQLFRTGCQQLQ